MNRLVHAGEKHRWSGPNRGRSSRRKGRGRTQVRVAGGAAQHGSCRQVQRRRRRDKVAAEHSSLEDPRGLSRPRNIVWQIGEPGKRGTGGIRGVPIAVSRVRLSKKHAAVRARQKSFSGSPRRAAAPGAGFGHRPCQLDKRGAPNALDPLRAWAQRRGIFVAAGARALPSLDTCRALPPPPPPCPRRRRWPTQLSEACCSP